MELSRTEKAAGHESQAERLRDGKVSFSEYQAAFNELSECLAAAGITVSEPVLSPVSNNRYEFTMDVGSLETEVGSELSDDCAEEHWTSVSQGYTFTTPSVMDVAVRDAAAECLEEIGLEPSGDERSAFDFAALPDANPDEVTECIILAVEEIYPGLPAVTVAF